MSSLKFSGEFENGLKYEIHTIASFSGTEELAVIIDESPASIISVRKRLNSIEVKQVPTIVKSRCIKESEPVIETLKKNRLSEG